MDFTSVDHKEVSSLTVGFRDCSLFSQTLSCRTESLSDPNASFPPDTERVFLLLFITFPGCESPEEQQKSDHYCPDRSCKFSILPAAVV